MSSKKGFVYMMEVLLAMSLIFVTLAFLFRFSQPVSQTSLPIIRKSGMEAMEFMDQHHQLRKWVAEGNEAEIERVMGTLLPENIKFEAEICAAACNTAGVNTQRNVLALDYYVMAYRDEFLGKKVRVWLWI